MFQERSDEKQNWRLIIIVMSLVIVFSVSIIVVFRVLLDSEDEINQPIISDPIMRNRMTVFLGLFTMTFFFGCWCCFCCGGNLCLWIPKCPEGTKLLIDTISMKFISSHPSIRRKLSLELDSVMEIQEVVVDNGPVRKMGTRPSDMNNPFERPTTIPHLNSPTSTIEHILTPPAILSPMSPQGKTNRSFSII